MENVENNEKVEETLENDATQNNSEKANENLDNEGLDNEKENVLHDIEDEEKVKECKLEEKLNDSKSENKKLKDENKKLENELKEIKRRFERMDKEYENFRNRTEKEKKAIYTDACSDVLKNMFPVLDNLDRAIKAEGNKEDLKKGIEAVTKQFMESLKKLDVEEIPSQGEFDPNYHNAIMHIEDENFGENEIVEVFQKGFKRGDKVLRHSLVKVAN